MTLRAGIVGCGGISRAHATAYANLEGVTLSALCDISPDALNLRADEHDVSARYTDYEEMFRQEELDVVSVCTHAPLHGPVAISAAKHGINVLSEKPL
ncbi:MAG: Gfo/Idh/MocA family oxidoreductase, partial [Caldilineaceae bacterium SB0670_bin_27]|nr:Gfo/Idh/MocA family oxidoreductase [Caldilineaceae bacterium SB0670_bin_27]